MLLNRRMAVSQSIVCTEDELNIWFVEDDEYRCRFSDENILQ